MKQAVTEFVFRVCKTVGRHNEIFVHPPIFTSTLKKDRPAEIGMTETARATNEQGPLPPALSAASPMEDKLARIGTKTTNRVSNEQGYLNSEFSALSPMEDHSGRIGIEETEQVTNETASTSSNQLAKGNTKIPCGLKRWARRHREMSPELTERKSPVHQDSFDGNYCNLRSTRVSIITARRVSVADPSDSERSSVATRYLCKKRSFSEGTDDNTEQANQKINKEQQMYNKEIILASVKALGQTRTIKCPFCPLMFNNIGKNLFHIYLLNI